MVGQYSSGDLPNLGLRARTFDELFELDGPCKLVKEKLTTVSSGVQRKHTTCDGAFEEKGRRQTFDAAILTDLVPLDPQPDGQALLQQLGKLIVGRLDR